MIGATRSVSLKGAMNWSKLRGGVEFGARSWYVADFSAHAISTFIAQGVPTALAAATLVVAKFRRDTRLSRAIPKDDFSGNFRGYGHLF